MGVVAWLYTNGVVQLSKTAPYQSFMWGWTPHSVQ